MDTPSPKVKACLSILKKVPVTKYSETLTLLKDSLASSESSLNELFLRVIDFPLRILEDPVTNRRFLLCELNKIGSSYRSPYSNTFVPPIVNEHPLSNDELRMFESHANEVWDVYTQLYYGKEALGSVYVKEASSSFLVCFLVSKTIENDERLAAGQWNSMHMVHVGKVDRGACTYKVNSQVVFSMDPNSDTTLGASLSRTTEQSHRVIRGQQYQCHLENMGKMIEDIEIDIRSNLEVVTIPKTHQVASGLRHKVGGSGVAIPVMAPVRPRSKGGLPIPGMMMGGAHAAALNAAILKRAPKSKKN